MYQQAKAWQSGLQTSYWRHESGCMIVTLQCLNQTISVIPGFFKKVLQIDYNVEVGCRDITVEQAVKLGFIFSEHKKLRIRLASNPEHL